MIGFDMIQAQEVMDVISGKRQWAFLNTDGFKLAKAMPAPFVDVYIGDPPYDEKTHKGARTMKNGGGDLGIDFDVLPDTETFVPDLLRVTRRWVACFCTQEMVSDYERGTKDSFFKRKSEDKNYIRALWWHRTNACPCLTGDRPGVPGESIALMHSHRYAKKEWARDGHAGFYSGNICSDQERLGHTTQKPLWLMERLVIDFSKKEEVVLDCTAGVATTGVAALNLGRRFIGCELKGPCPKCGGGAAMVEGRLVARPCEHGWRNYYDVGRNRLARTSASGVQKNLFEREKKQKKAQGNLF